MVGHRATPIFPLATLLLLGAVAEALASDGAIEISQTGALAGGTTAGDLPGFPVDLNQSGHYILTSGLDITAEASPENVNVIVVTASGVSIDMNGFGIVGATVCNGTPVSACAPSGTGVGILFSGGEGSVKDGGVTGMGHRGIDMSASQVAAVQRVAVSHSGENGIALPAGSVAQRASASTNGGIGISVGGSARVIDSSAFGNGGIGISLGDGSRVEGSIASSNGGAGVSLGAAAVAEKCIANGNADAGITSTFGGIVRASVAVINAVDGIRVGGQSTLTGNNAYSNSGDGIEAGDGSTVIGNNVSGNTGYGLNIGSGSGYQGNVINNNVTGTVNGASVETGGNVCAGNSTCP